MFRVFQIIYLIGVLAISSCSTEKHIASTPPLEHVVKLQKTPCYGDCPAYNFQALNDGHATLIVGRITSAEFGLGLKEGEYEGTINSEDLKEIIDLAEALGYFSLKPKYDDEKVMDLPAAISSIEGHRVFNRFEGPNLDPLYSLIEQKMVEIQWHPKTEN